MKIGYFFWGQGAHEAGLVPLLLDEFVIQRRLPNAAVAERVDVILLMRRLQVFLNLLVSIMSIS